MITYIWLTLLSVFFFGLIDGADIKFTDSKSLVNVEAGNNVTLMWSLYNIQRKTNIYLYFDNKNTEIGSLVVSSISQNYTTRARFLDLGKPLATRIKDFKMVLSEGNGTLKFTIEDLKYDDSGVLIVTNEDGSKLKAQHNLTLNVEGGPHECGVKSLPKNITCSHGQVITQKVTLCGKPQPEVTWKIGEKEINETVDKTEIDKHQYTYTLKTKLTSDMCGRELSYVANGYHRGRTASSMILVKGLGIENVFQRSNQSESFISWGVKDYGLCDVEVQFSFTNITTKLVSASNKMFSYRDPRAADVQTRYRTFVYVNLSSGERIRISQSGWKNVTYIKEKTTTTQKPTPTTTTKNRWGDIDNEDSDDEGEVSMFLLVGDIIGFVLLFILLGILWKLGKVVQRHHHKRKVSAKRSRKVMANRALKAVQDNAKPSTSKAKNSKRRQAQEAAIQEPSVQGQSTYDTVAEPVGQKSEEELSKLYAKVDKSNKKKPPVANVLYSELSALGGRTGDKTNAPKSEYAEAKDL